ncbi:phage terminase large subunit family protein [Candidatus Pacearchaeota archaeon]|nr:phage terminase large subunit family protein [Candidatus Pacearchaeota archaeon]
MAKRVITMTRSEFAERFLYLNGRPFSLDDYPFLHTIYNENAKKIVLKFSRQTAKSSTMANIMIVDSAMNPYYKSMYVAPTVDQTKVFSHDRVAPILESSPFIKDHYLSSALVQNVHRKQLLNGSNMYLRYALQSADRLRGYSCDTLYFDECFSDTTEILTDSGWKLFKNLNQSELLATRNVEGNLEYQKPTRYIEKEYQGDLLNFTHRSFKLTTTPGHRLFISQELNTGCYKDHIKYNGWHKVKAEDAEHKNFKMISVAPYKGKSTKTITIPGFSTKIKANGQPYQDKKTRSYSDEVFEIKAFMAFMGWFLSEGHLSNNSRTIFISQKEGTDAEEIRECLQGMGIKHHEYVYKTGVISFYFSNATLHNYLKKFGHSHDKYISNDLLEQIESLSILLDALYKGDAMKHEGDINKFGELNTASSKLADTTQLAWMYLGRKATIRQIVEKNGTIMYRIRPLQLDYQVFWKAQNRVKRVPYQGKVYCATVPNGTLFVRDSKEKTIVISGNCQDLKADIIPVAEEAMSRSLVKRSIYSGTPKRSKGTLADFWFRSTQNEYMLRCGACNKWNILDEDSIGDFSLICKKCSRELDPRTSRGEWVSTYPQSVHGRNLVGYRVCLLHFAKAPWVDWNRDVIVKRRNQSKALFYNETLGLEHDTGVSPITRTELYNACQIDKKMNDEPDRLEKSYQSIMGIDYGPVNSENSNTVISIIQMRGDNRYHVVYAKKFIGKEADYAFIHAEVPRLMEKWNCTHLAADYGMGEAPNSEIRSRIGYQKVIAFQHMASQKKRINWNADMPAYTMNRNQVMTEVFDHIRKGKLLFPQLSDVEECIEDILNIQTEFNEELGRMKFTNMGPDDFFHATLFAILANQMLYSVNSF